MSCVDLWPRLNIEHLPVTQRLEVYAEAWEMVRERVPSTTNFVEGYINNKYWPKTVLSLVKE